MSRKAMIWLCVGVPAVGVLVLTVVIPLAYRVYQEVSGQTAEPRPPDLSKCTRVELHYRQHTPGHVLAGQEESNLLSIDEQEYLKSIESIVLSDPEEIKVLADGVASAKYEYRIRAQTLAADYVRIIGYSGPKRTTSFMIWAGAKLETDDGYAFVNTNLFQCLWNVRPQVWPYKWRIYCAQNLQILQKRLNDMRDTEGKYAAPSQWCGAIERHLQALNRSDDSSKKLLQCPSIREGKSTYAMNPDCTSDSPADTVLLFETKPGWNQHGGPELFTFDNHDPRGGLVLLNDGTVKFIRTEEELKQLRWK